LVSSLDADKLAHPWGGGKWTTDGESLIYLVDRGSTSNVGVQSLSGSAPRQLTTFPKGYVYEYAFSRDGKKLYVAHGYQIRDAVLIKNF
ncbi:MAG TPA: hypothetical protein VJ864_13945, partial [Candidatus Binatia bacterium]|nr:hypothetical protein [Candidatus Binatia bacterium]